MKQEDFNKIVDETLAACCETLAPKGEEYSRCGDRLHNFKVAAALQGTTPERALWGMAVKHIVSIQDIIDDPNAVREETFYEKTQDLINYIILLTAMVRERRGWQ